MSSLSLRIVYGSIILFRPNLSDILKGGRFRGTIIQIRFIYGLADFFFLNVR